MQKKNDGDDDVIINRPKRKRQMKDDSEAVDYKKKQQDSDNSDDDDFGSKLQKQIRITAVLLFAFAIILFLAMISYNPRDEANTEISFVEFFKLLAGDTFVKAKFETVSNWLGVFGAILSDFFYNNLLGFITILIPLYLVLWAKELFMKLAVSKDLARRTILYLFLALMFSSFIGTLQLIPVTEAIPREWSGSIGQFMSSMISGFIGNIGTLVIVVAGAICAIIFGTRFDINAILERLKLSDRKPFRAIINLKSWIMNKLSSNKTERGNESKLEVFDFDNESIPSEITINRTEFIANEESEPAQPIKRNISFPDTGKLNVVRQVVENISDEPDIDNGEQIAGSVELDNDFGNIDQLDDIDEIDTDFRELEDIDDSGDHVFKKPLTVTVNTSSVVEDLVEPINPLSTSIHDEDINYIPPTLELLVLEDELTDVNDEELAQNARILREKLETFKIEIDNLSVTPGPVVTQYEFVPAPGIKVSRIESLSDDIAMALKARGIRIIAPIPGKGTVGIEIPNKKASIVRFSNIIKSSRFHLSDHKLPLALGKTIGGEVYCADLTKMPHLLIAGSTGSGKSVGINTILASLLYKKHPSELKFVIIDPKKVELNQYSLLEKHFIAMSPDIEDLIITSPEDAVIVLKAVCAEMDRRYDILSQVGQRNLLDYNIKVQSGRYADDKELIHRPMPYIVVIVDELADLMMTAAKEVEAPIIRIAQLARAVGIHLVVATQRPSVDVITGIIKANFPARIAYLASSKIDSRTILDQSGAEQLLGNGDMLFMPGGSPKPIRIQNSFISTDEVEALCEHIGNQQGYSQPYMLPSLIEDSSGAGGISKEDRDPLFEQAARMIINVQQASVSVIQRRMKVGYARAGKIIDELEDAGVIGPYAGSKPRDVRMESESELEAIL